MKDSIKKLRDSYAEYMRAKQARYDELTTWGAYDSDALEKHKAIVKRINLEQSALDMEWPDEKPTITCGAVVNTKGLFARWGSEGWESLDEEAH